MGRRFGIIFAVLIVLMFASLTEGSGGEERKIISAAPYSGAELKGNTQVLIKERPSQLSDEGINAIFKEVTSRIKTFDGEKYDRFNANLILEGSGLVAQDIWNFQFLYNLQGMRENKTESWQIYIELITDGNKVLITQITADRTLVPDRYVEIGKEIALKNLDDRIRARTPEVTDSKWIMESNGTIVLTFKNPDGSEITDVTLNLNEEKITNIEKHYWGETFNLSIIEAFVNPGYEMGFYSSGNELAVFLYLKTDTIYGCYNFKIIANTTDYTNRTVVDISRIDRQGGYCETAMGPAHYAKEIGDPKGEFDLIIRYEGEEDRYKLEVSEEYINITPLKTGFTNIGHPLSLLRIPKNTIWVECGHYGRIGCEENNEYTSVCQKFFDELEKLGAKPFTPQKGTYAFEGFNIPGLTYFRYTEDNSKLENLIKKYSANTDKSIENKEKCTLLSINTWRGEWFFSWNEAYKDLQVSPDITSNIKNEEDRGVKTSGFELILGLAALVLAVRWRRAGGFLE